jgi:hypothetical protein
MQPDGAGRIPGRLVDAIADVSGLDPDRQPEAAHALAVPLLRELDGDGQAVAGAELLRRCLGVEAEMVRAWLDEPPNGAGGEVSDRLYAHLLPESIARERARREARRIVDAMGEGAEATQPRSWTLAELLADPSIVELPAPVVPMLAWPGRATLLAAAEKLGKSTFAGAAAAAVSAGRPWLDGETIAGPVLWAAEESPGDVARRLRDFGADASAVTIMTWGADPVGEIRAEVERVRPVLTIIDTLQAIAEHARPESGRASDWAAIMRPLVRIARDTGTALPILHHARRSDGAYRDSSEIAAAVDIIVEMSGSDTDTLRRLAWRGRYGRGSYAVRLAGGRYELLDREDEGEALADEILRYVAAHPGTGSTAITGEVRARDRDILRTLADLVAAGRLADDGTEYRHRYRVPDPARTGQGSTSEDGSPARLPALPDARQGTYAANGPVAERDLPMPTHVVGRARGAGHDEDDRPLHADPEGEL